MKHTPLRFRVETVPQRRRIEEGKEGKAIAVIFFIRDFEPLAELFFVHIYRGPPVRERTRGGEGSETDHREAVKPWTASFWSSLAGCWSASSRVAISSRTSPGPMNISSVIFYDNAACGVCVRADSDRELNAFGAALCQTPFSFFFSLPQSSFFPLVRRLFLTRFVQMCDETLLFFPQLNTMGGWDRLSFPSAKSKKNPLKVRKSLTLCVSVCQWNGCCEPRETFLSHFFFILRFVLHLFFSFSFCTSFSHFLSLRTRFTSSLYAWPLIQRWLVAKKFTVPERAWIKENNNMKRNDRN